MPLSLSSLGWSCLETRIFTFRDTPPRVPYTLHSPDDVRYHKRFLSAVYSVSSAGGSFGALAKPPLRANVSNFGKTSRHENEIGESER